MDARGSQSGLCIPWWPMGTPGASRQGGDFKGKEKYTQVAVRQKFIGRRGLRQAVIRLLTAARRWPAEGRLHAGLWLSEAAASLQLGLAVPKQDVLIEVTSAARLWFWQNLL